MQYGLYTGCFDKMSPFQMCTFVYIIVRVLRMLVTWDVIRLIFISVLPLLCTVSITCNGYPHFCPCLTWKMHCATFARICFLQCILFLLQKEAKKSFLSYFRFLLPYTCISSLPKIITHVTTHYMCSGFSESRAL